MEDPTTASALGGAAGAIGAKAIDWTAEKAKELAQRFKDRELAFIENPEDVEVVKRVRKTAEYEFLREYAPSSKHRVIMQMGPALRHAENDPDRVQRLRDAIKRAHGVEGLRLAECVQSGIFQLMYDRLLHEGVSEEKLEQILQHAIRNIDDYVLFVKEVMDPRSESQTAKTRIDTEKPPIFVVASRGSASEVAREIARNLRANLLDYQEPRRVEEDHLLMVVFLRTDLDAG